MYNIETFGGIQLVNADCMEVMHDLPDNAFDLAICDPPYGIGIAGQKECICKNPKHNRKHHENKGWDELPPRSVFSRIGTCFTQSNYLGCKLLCRQLDERHKRLDMLVQRSNRAYNVRLRVGVFII